MKIILAQRKTPRHTVTMSKDTATSHPLEALLTGESSTKKALIKHLTKQAKAPRQKRNEHPERDMQKKIYSWARSVGMELSITDASAFNHMYESPFPVGHSDLTGDDVTGIATYIEVKAPGKRKNISYNQYQFLLNKINRGCFAVVSDSVELTNGMYKRFIEHRITSPKAAMEYLTSILPVKTRQEDEFDLSDED